jgi:hypothetical protein
MASARQLAANRRNGLKGGPRTEAGKQRSRLNSLKHGLTSAALVVLPEEHQHEYQEVLRGFRVSFNPCDAAEEALVLRLAHAHWRSLRSRRIETGMLNVSASVQRGRAREWVENCPQHLNPHEAIGVGFMSMPPEHWQMYLRYDTTISRDFFRTLDALTKLQRMRKAMGHQPAPAISRNDTTPDPPPLVLAAGAGPQLSDHGIRSVSQNTVSTPETIKSTEPAPQTAPPPAHSNAASRVITQSAQNANFRGPDTNPASGYFGRVTGAADAVCRCNSAPASNPDPFYSGEDACR